jgi:hypothetical protein
MAELRRCLGSAKFGIEPHDAPVADFPKQPSQKDGLGRMCKRHWNAYTTALRKAALERRSAQAEATPGITADDAAATQAKEPPAVITSARGRGRAAEAEELAQEATGG